MEERLLVKRAAKGDAEAFGQLYATCYKRLYQYALYTLKNTEDAEDVVSDTVTDAFASIGKLKKEEAFQSWIYAILVNKCCAKRKEYLSKTYELTEEIQNKSDYEESIRQHEMRVSREESMDMQKYLLDLPEEERMILSMNIFLGYSTKEIASVMQLNENTVRSKKCRVIERLRGKMKEA